MTIKMPKVSLADKILKLMGKKRGVILPSGVCEKFNSDSTYSVAVKESFFIAVFRPANKPLPDGVIDIHSFASLKKVADKE